MDNIKFDIFLAVGFILIISHCSANSKFLAVEFQIT